MTFRHTLPIQLRFSDTDALGHVNNSSYFTFFDLGKTRYICDVLGRQVPAQDMGIVLRHAETDFLHPLFYTDDASVQTRLECIGNHSFTLMQQIVNNRTGQVHCTCRNVMVGFDPATGLSTPISDELRQAMTRYEADSDDVQKG
ncbi:MAG: acyl-CoA thioesterase [Paludibacteraceae bacterium]|nr:acyl-CoA thioesterase [Paludibacteraceae bacterium]